MRNTALAGLFMCVVFIFAQSPKANANPLDFKSNINQEYVEIAVLDIVKPKVALIEQVIEPVKVEPLTYIVKKGDSLASIAKAHNTTWERLFDKNLNISNPDIIDVDLNIVIPTTDETLTKREIPINIPTPAPAPAPSPATSKPTSRAVKSVRAPRPASIAGNTYSAGYCTWYAKNKRPDLPNNLGNANTWASRAANQGIPTGSVPRIGAIGQQGMHVVYVEDIYSNGTILVSEMNYAGWNKISSRTTSASNFRYIY